MNTSPLCQKTSTRSPKLALLCYSSLAVVLSFLCLGMGMLLPLFKNEVGNNFPRPPGQLQADARTLVAAVRYLLEPEPHIETVPAAFSGSTVTFTQQALGQPFETSVYSSNRTEMPSAPSTNPPARS